MTGEPRRRRWGSIVAGIILAIIGVAFLAAVATSILGRLSGGGVGPAARLKGRPAPDFTADALNGGTVRLGDYRGKVVLLDFWASWCAPCRAEMPNVKRLYEEYHPKGLEIIGISLDRTVSDARSFAEDHGMSWIQVWDSQSGGAGPAEEYGVTAIPVTFLIDRSGTVREVGLRGSGLDAPIRALLAEGAGGSEPGA
jgi:peroxiredoxin